METEWKLAPEVKALWVPDLRSGKNKQIRRRLHAEDGFCCLGRLCDLYAQKIDSANIGWKEKACEEPNSPVNFFDGSGNSLNLPPNSVVTWAFGRHIFHKDKTWIVPGLIDRAGHSLTLFELNDDGFTFDQIADVIEYFL